MATLLRTGSPSLDLAESDWTAQIDVLLESWIGQVHRLLIVPPDRTRSKSLAGEITAHLWKQLAGKMHVDILPALGTHAGMTQPECRHMFGPDVPFERIQVHDFVADTVSLGELPASLLHQLSAGQFAQPAAVAINRHLLGEYDLVLSLGQVVPHEVVGMANYTKNIVIGVGGPDLIHKSHFLGALYGIERIMGQIDTPVRRLLDTAFDTYVRPRTQVMFLLTVLQSVAGRSVLRGLYCGDDYATFQEAAVLSQQVNIVRVSQPLKRCVVYLDPHEFSTTWVGNKAIYRTRRAMADGGELLILAPNVGRFGEKTAMDALIRRHGYCGTPATMDAIRRDPDLANNLSAAAHLIHGSTEGRFQVTYCPGPGLSSDDVQGVGFRYRNFDEAASQYYQPDISDGWHSDRQGEPFYFIRDPGQGLWIA